MTNTCLSCKHLRQRTAKHCSVTTVYYCYKGYLPISSSEQSVITHKHNGCYESRVSASNSVNEMEAHLL